MTIAEASRKYGLSADALRYYERVGIIPRVPRTKSGIRDYDEASCGWIELTKCLRSAGVQIEALIQYSALFQLGEEMSMTPLGEGIGGDGGGAEGPAGGAAPPADRAPGGYPAVPGPPQHENRVLRPNSPGEGAENLRRRQRQIAQKPPGSPTPRGPSLVTFHPPRRRPRESR